MRTSLGDWTAALLATLGLAPLGACGGTVAGQTERAENGGRAPGSGGDVSSGGYFGGDGAFGADGGPWFGAGGLVSTGGAATGGVTIGPPPCRNPSPLIGFDGRPTGFSTCEGGVLHRTEQLDCPSKLPRATRCPVTFVPDAGSLDPHCSTDADCSSSPHGFCSLPSADLGIAGCICETGCVRDADCGPGQICLCEDPVGRCYGATCTTTSDCPGENLCLSHTPGIRCRPSFACQTSADNCMADSDCPYGWYCAMIGDVRSCREGSSDCIAGRPFLVGGAPRVAGVAKRRDWSSSLSPCLNGLDPVARDALAAHFTQVALTEHASIAAFARFVLELLSLGAPPEFVAQAQEAMVDETVHACDAFALASAYAGRPVGPGELDVTAALSFRSPLDIVRTTIIEGCIGETVAAVEAAEALSQSTDPAVREALARVTEDEARHAELAWRFVQWILTRGDPRVRAGAARMLVEIIAVEADAASSARPEFPRSETTLLAHGMLGNDARHEIRRRVITEVVLPCALALVAESSRAGEGLLRSAQGF